MNEVVKLPTDSQTTPIADDHLASFESLSTSSKTLSIIRFSFSHFFHTIPEMSFNVCWVKAGPHTIPTKVAETIVFFSSTGSRKEQNLFNLLGLNLHSVAIGRAK
jgi:hypothetical protein